MKPKIIVKRRGKDGTEFFYLRYRIPGYPRREPALKGCATLKEAEGLAALYIPKIAKGIDPFISDKPLAEWVSLYEKRVGPDLKPATRENQRKVFRWVLAWLARNHPRVKSAKDVTAPILIEYRNERLRAPKMVACAEPPRDKIPPGVVKVGKQWKRPHETETVSPRTWNLERSYLLTLFDFIAGELQDYENPVRKTPRAVDETKRRRSRIREDYLLPLLAELSERYGHRHALWLETTIACMLRPNEVSSRKPGHVDRFARVLWLDDTKTHEEDTVAIPDDLLQRLVELAEQTPKDGYLFPTTNAMRGAIRACCAKLQIPAVSLYSGRHTGISRALDNGALPHDVMRSARHKDFKTTQNYIHGSDHGKRKAANAASIGATPPRKSADVLPIPNKK
jgi:integrase